MCVKAKVCARFGRRVCDFIVGRVLATEITSEQRRDAGKRRLDVFTGDGSRKRERETVQSLTVIRENEKEE